MSPPPAIPSASSRDDTSGARPIGTLTGALPLAPSALGLRLAVFVAGLVGACLLATGLVAPELSTSGRASLAVASLAIGLWGSELLPLPVTALLTATGAVDRTERALIGLSSPVLAFLLGSAALGIAAEQSGLADRLAARLVARAGRSGWRVLADLLLTLPLQALAAPSAMSRNA